MGSCQSHDEAAVATMPAPIKNAEPRSTANNNGATANTKINANSSDSSDSNKPITKMPPASSNTPEASTAINNAPLNDATGPLESSTHSQVSLKSFDSAHSNGKEATIQSQASGGSTVDMSSTNGAGTPSGDAGSVSSSSSRSDRRNPKTLGHSSSVVGLDSMIENRRESNLLTNVVHMEVPFGKPIEEVYDGVHTGPVLGSGISGIVRLVVHKATGVEYAVKCLDLGLIGSKEGLQQLREEIFIMCQLDHPNIVRLEEVYESHSEIYLVQELCLGGELFDRLDEQPDYHYTEAECARLIKQMLCAVRYLHSKGIIHRDLKLENFLFSSTATDSELKMIDFGLSKHFQYGEMQHEAVGTPYTVAPEVIRGQYDERCDIWAIGVIAFLLLSGDSPFGGCGGPEPLVTVRSNILRGAFEFEPQDIWSLVSERAREFIRSMLVIDPQQRPTARGAQKHPWLVEWANRSKTEGDNILNPGVVKALVAFKEFSDMRKLLSEVLSFTLLPEQIKDLRREFEKMDTDGSGEISLTALKQILLDNAGAGSLGALTESEVEDIFNAMRVNKSETRIHWHEFVAAGLSQCRVDDRNLRLAFDRLDSDHKGYVTIEDIMDLLGSDSLHSEEMMREMWGDSIRAVNCVSSIITYEDFLLLMKGQTRECVDAEKETVLQRLSSSKRLLMASADLASTDVTTGETKDGEIPIPPRSGVPLEPIISMAEEECAEENDDGEESDIIEVPTPTSSIYDDLGGEGGGINGQQTAKTTQSVFRVENRFTPPTTPRRSAADYVSPLSNKTDRMMLSDNGELSMPELSTSPATSLSDPVYVKKRSRSMDDDDNDNVKETKEEFESPRMCNADSRDSRRAVLLVEHERGIPIDADNSKSALQVNRQLYRAHRQMRMAVLDASKRFEEQQARHAREVLIAQKEASGTKNLIPAGLVMRRGQNKQVSSEAVSSLLQENRTQQQKLVEVANKRGGRGRRARKKTKSDMTDMMKNLSQEDLRGEGGSGQSDTNNAGGQNATFAPPRQASLSTPLAPLMENAEPEVRGATVPGNFRPVNDPFSFNSQFPVAS